MLTKKDVIQRAEEDHVKFVRLQFTDIFGMLKNIAITVKDLPRVLEGFELFDSSAVDGIVTSSKKQIRLMPDPNTFVIFPWRPKEGAVARLICDINNEDGTPYPGCSRNSLKKVLSNMKLKDIMILGSAKAEFYLFKQDEMGQPTSMTHDRGGFCDLTPLDLGENARREMVLTLEEMGFEIGSSHHEAGQGQHEIALKSDHILSLADKIATLRFVVRTIAQRHGLHASFMPKPFSDMDGSALQISFSLYKALQNVFYSHQENYQMSIEAQNFMAGILEHGRGLTAITNPLVNSYKRLIASKLSPNVLGWSVDNRATMLRIAQNSERELWLEVLSPDGCCNPYLALEVLLAAGIDGMEKSLELRKPYVPDELGEIVLPQNLNEALDLLVQDELVQKVLGKHIVDLYYNLKKLEWQRYQKTIHPWERNEYLVKY
ncbi:glutamine synthetase family protein [Bacillota bacterium LX-D]|nr:glutamine synthetase family protein [Bacillota bacterium LX-D]